jgi:hypothetical protein
MGHGPKKALIRNVEKKLVLLSKPRLFYAVTGGCFL